MKSWHNGIQRHNGYQGLSTVASDDLIELSSVPQRFISIGAVGACREEHGIFAGRVWRTSGAKKSG
jgi:hypothetical protein